MWRSSTHDKICFLFLLFFLWIKRHTKFVSGLNAEIIQKLLCRCTIKVHWHEHLLYLLNYLLGKKKRGRKFAISCLSLQQLHTRIFFYFGERMCTNDPLTVDCNLGLKYTVSRVLIWTVSNIWFLIDKTRKWAWMRFKTSSNFQF